jgi:hypothetical protein
LPPAKASWELVLYQIFFFPASEIAMIVPMAAAAGAVYVEVDSMLWGRMPWFRSHYAECWFCHGAAAELELWNSPLSWRHHLAVSTDISLLINCWRICNSTTATWGKWKEVDASWYMFLLSVWIMVLHSRICMKSYVILTQVSDPMRVIVFWSDFILDRRRSKRGTLGGCSGVEGVWWPYLVLKSNGCLLPSSISRRYSNGGSIVQKTRCPAWWRLWLSVRPVLWAREVTEVRTMPQLQHVVGAHIWRSQLRLAGRHVKWAGPVDRLLLALMLSCSFLSVRFFFVHFQIFGEKNRSDPKTVQIFKKVQTWIIVQIWNTSRFWKKRSDFKIVRIKKMLRFLFFWKYLN